MDTEPVIIKLGEYTLEERDAFLKKTISAYLERHPKANKKRIRKYARVKWSRKLDKELKAKALVNSIKGVEQL
jgi:hypothetical protein